MASENKSTIPTRTQDTISQHELTLLFITQNELAELTASYRRREGDVTRKLDAGVVVEPGRFFVTRRTSIEVRP